MTLRSPVNTITLYLLDILIFHMIISDTLYWHLEVHSAHQYAKSDIFLKRKFWIRVQFDKLHYSSIIVLKSFSGTIFKAKWQKFLDRVLHMFTLKKDWSISDNNGRYNIKVPWLTPIDITPDSWIDKPTSVVHVCILKQLMCVGPEQSCMSPLSALG